MTPIFFIFPIITLFFLLACLILKLLWNSTFPDLFGWKRISYWTSIKILLIAFILFGGYNYPFGYGHFVDTKAGEWIINNPLVIRISEQVGHNTAEQGAAANP